MQIIKTILKRIFPRPFLKEAFLIYNKVRIHTIDKVLFPEYLIDKDKFLEYRTGYPFRENKIKTDSIKDERVKQYMENWNSWTQEEYLLLLKTPCFIEPEYGWAIVPPNKLVYFSLGISRTPFQKKPDLRKFLRKRNVETLPLAISIRDTGEENYFHFFNDVLTKIFFLKSNGVDVENIPIIISSKLWEKTYFQLYYKQSSLLASIKWIVQDQQYIHCDSVYFCKPLTHRIDLWQLIITPFLKEAKDKPRKIFITRSKNRLRFLENADQIENVFSSIGFEIIDADNYSTEDQIRIFSDAECIAGIHGAGLTNMVYRNGVCKVFEIFPPPEQGYLPFHYIMLAQMKAFDYQAIIGEKGLVKYSGGFYVEPAKVREQLLQLYYLQFS